MPQQRLGLAAILGRERDAGAGMHIERVAADGEGSAQRRLDIAAQLFEVGTGHLAHADHCELVATDPRHEIAGPRTGADASAHPLQQLVTGAMAERVVDDLEVVEIEAEHAERLAAREPGRNGLIEGEAVGEAGQLVAPREVMRVAAAGFGQFGNAFDDLGRGDDEGKRNFGEVTDSAASKSVELLKSISSTGYLRKRLPQELVVFQGGAATAFQTNADATAFTAVVAESSTALATGTVSMDARTKAKMQGYEGDPCGECGNYTLVRNGTCMKCNTCGGTSGCS